jgi:GTPase SAR1 family protein
MRLAILIVGLQNSGKTSTIKHLISAYNGRTLKIMKAGWKDIFLNPLLKSLRLNFYCIPASPTETKIKLSERCATWFPEVLVIAEQAGGANYADTISFLTTNHYHVLRYDILNTNGASDWERFNVSNMSSKLGNRADEIVNDIKQFLKTSGII